MERKVFVNRTLNLRKIRYLGFDMDHTLVRYHTEKFEKTAFELALQCLVRRGYPEEILALPFDFQRAIRGLVMDKRNGNLIKVNRYSSIRAAYHGTRQLSFQEFKASYASTYIDLRDKRYVAVDTAFAISSVNLFLQLMDFKQRVGYPADYETIATDLLDAVDDIHRDQSLKNTVRKDLSKYIVQDAELVEGLERYRKHGKILFIVTNSDFGYTKELLDFAINPYLKEHAHWKDLFTYVVTAAQKPRFFWDDLRFLKVNYDSGLMENLSGKLVPGIYQAGCAKQFSRQLEADGDDILYIGDHIYGDILRLKKDCNWRTAMVVEELDHEISCNQQAQPIQEMINALMEQKEPSEDQIVSIVSEAIEQGDSPIKSKLEALQAEVTEIDKSIGELILRHQKIFNPYWGEVMRTGNEESYFAHQLERFACIYMSKLGDLLSQSPRMYFRAGRRPLAHE